MNVGTKNFVAGQPVFVIDTATTSNMEQASTTVYAQGGKGYNRLIAWEGEKTLTFTVTDALMSPLGLKVLTGAGLAAESAVKHIHVTIDTATDKDGKFSIALGTLVDELGLPRTTESVKVCTDANIKPYATILDNNGAIKGWAESVTFDGATAEELVVTSKLEGTVTGEGVKNATVKLDFYVVLTNGATEITIAPEDFGGYFYVEADTLYRNQDGKDMAATITFPKVKVQSGFTLTMAANGDPSELMRLAA